MSSSMWSISWSKGVQGLVRQALILEGGHFSSGIFNCQCHFGRSKVTELCLYIQSAPSIMSYLVSFRTPKSKLKGVPWIQCFVLKQEKSLVSFPPFATITCTCLTGVTWHLDYNAISCNQLKLHTLSNKVTCICFSFCMHNMMDRPARGNNQW